MDNEPDRSAELVDVANISLIDMVGAGGDSPVARSIARLRRNLDDPEGVLSAFSSFLDES